MDGKNHHSFIVLLFAAGIYSVKYTRVRDVAAAFESGKLSVMNDDQACSGGSNCHH